MFILFHFFSYAKAFSKDFWNCFDVFTGVASIFDAIISEILEKQEENEMIAGPGHVNPWAYAMGDEEGTKKVYACIFF